MTRAIGRLGKRRIIARQHIDIGLVGLDASPPQVDLRPTAGQPSVLLARLLCGPDGRPQGGGQVCIQDRSSLAVGVMGARRGRISSRGGQRRGRAGRWSGRGYGSRRVLSMG
jgi:hypothetical protein